MYMSPLVSVADAGALLQVHADACLIQTRPAAARARGAPHRQTGLLYTVFGIY